jgi:hypothetical protein
MSFGTDLSKAAEIAGLDPDEVLAGPLTEEEIDFFLKEIRTHQKTLGITKGPLAEKPGVDKELQQVRWLGFWIAPGLQTTGGIGRRAVLRAYTLTWQGVTSSGGEPDDYYLGNAPSSVNSLGVVPEMIKMYIDSLYWGPGPDDDVPTTRVVYRE